MNPLFVILFWAVILILIVRLLVKALEHNADRTRHYCKRCGEELLPSSGRLWSGCSEWECKKCGVWGNDLTSTISLPQSCCEATRQAIYQRVEAAQRARKDNAVDAAKDFLLKKGLKFIEANSHSERGDIDLIFRDSDCLVFVEVEPCLSKNWPRPATDAWCGRRNAVRDYLRLLRDAKVKIRLGSVEVLLVEQKIRFDTVEVLLAWDGTVPNESGQYLCFEMVKGFRAWSALKVRHLLNTNRVEISPVSADLSELWTKLVGAIFLRKQERPAFDLDLSPEGMGFLHPDDLVKANLVSFDKNNLVIGFDPEFEQQLNSLDTIHNRALLKKELAELGYTNCQIKFVKAKPSAVVKVTTPGDEQDSKWN